MARHHNIIAILTHGHRADMVGILNDWPIITPYLDTIAERGIGLASLTASTDETAARVSLFTGLHPRQHGYACESLEEPTNIGGWVQRFHEGGYHVAGVGRVGMVREHLDDACIVQPVSHTQHNPNDETCCTYLEYMQRRGMLERVQTQRRQRNATGPFDMQPAGISAYADDVDYFIGKQAADRIKTMPTDRPWLLIVGFTGPGSELPAPPKFIKPLVNKHIPGGFVPADLGRIDRYARHDYPRTHIQNMGPATIENIRRHYLARIILIDQMVGAIYDQLDQHRLVNHTWVTLTSDHGYLLGERGVVGRQSQLGPALYTPMWFLPPEPVIDEMPPHDEIETDPNHRILTTGDYAATLCAIAQLDPPTGCDGESTLPVMMGNSVGRSTQISESGHRLLLETMQHRVVFDTETEEILTLFDLMRDPLEKDDLAGTDKELEVADTLRWQLAGALMPLRSTQFV
ncbi:MAG: sulfatase-like hydrolase/transferase [Planctomycetota bacterium]|jgi:arylsulfatase A-like enzyme